MPKRLRERPPEVHTQDSCVGGSSHVEHPSLDAEGHSDRCVTKDHVLLNPLPDKVYEARPRHSRDVVSCLLMEAA
jgi:hypothetical protein